MSNKNCAFTPKGSSKALSYDEMRAYLLDNYDLVEGGKGGAEPPKSESGKESPKRKLRGTIEAFVERSDLDQETKDALLADERSYFETLGLDEAQNLAKSIIDDLGVEEAVREADRAAGGVPVELQSLIYGEALNYAKEQGKKATTKADKDYWADYENDVHEKLAAKATQFGRYNAYIQTIYYESPYALVRKARKKVDQRNKVFAPNAKKQAKEVQNILDNPEDAEAAMEEAVRSAVETAVSEKEKQIKELEKKLAESKKEAKKSKGKKRKYIVSDEAYQKARKALFGKASANPYLDPETWSALGTMAAYHLERGYYKFADFYKKMLKDTKGAYEEYFADLYASARDKAVEDGISESEFNTDDEVVDQATQLADQEAKLKAEIARKKQEAAEAKKWVGKGLDKQIKDALIEAGYGKTVSGVEQVDWKKVTAGSKSAEPVVKKIKETLEGKIPADQLDVLMDAIEKRANEIITEKKATAIATKIKQINRYKNNRLLNSIKRNTRIQGLVETWRQGGLTEKDILERLGQDFGIISFTDEDEKIIQDLVEQIDSAPPGAEKERIEERLQAFLEYAGHPLFLPRKFLERNKARLLSGPITLIKNMSGGIEAATAIAYKGLLNQFSTKGLGDKEIVKVFFKAHKKAFVTALDILWRGGIDTGTAQSEITKNKEGSPSVRYAENPRASYKKIGAYQRAGSALDIIERPFMRFMSAFDTFNQVLLQEVEAYDYAKKQLRKANPNASNSELSQRAYELTYAVEINEAEQQAQKEFDERGIKIEGIAGYARFNRRVHEIVEQKRSEETTKAAQFYGNRYTYKAYDPGLVSGATYIVQQVKNSITKSMGKLKKSDNPAVVRAAEVIDLSLSYGIDWLIPFIKTVGNIVEKGMELYPSYGYAKALAYTAAAGYNKATGNKLEGIDMQRAGEYYWRASVGLAITALLTYLADDDEEDKMKAIYGEGSDQFSERMNRSRQRPKNTIRIDGHNIPLDLLGTFSIPMKIEAAQIEAGRYPNKEVSTAIGTYLNLLNNLYFEKTGTLIEAMKSGNERRLHNMLINEAAELSTRAIVPSTQLFRQAGQVIDPQAKKPLIFTEKLQKYSGIGTIILDRPAIDYRGKTYDMGQVFSSSADGFVKMFSKEIKIDDVDKLVFAYHPSLMIPSRGEEAFQVLEGGERVSLSEADFYEVCKKTGDNLNSLLEKWVVKQPYTPSDISKSEAEKYMRMAEDRLSAEGKPISNDKVIDEAREIAKKKQEVEDIKEKLSELNTIAKNAAIEQYYKDHGKRVPLTKVGSIEKYEMELSVLNRLNK
jgi:hypothetical protein